MKLGFACVWRREWRRIGNNRNLLFLTLIGPLLGFLLILYIFSENVPQKLPIGLVDHDHSSLSRKVAQYISATSIAQIENVYSDVQQAKVAVENGEIEAVVYIPNDLEKNVFKGKRTSIELFVNNANVLKGGLITSGIRRAIATISAGIKIQTMTKSGLNQEQAYNKAFPVQIRQVTLFNPYTNYSYYLTAALLPVLLVLFIMLGTGYSIGIEFYKGTGPQWLRLSGDSIGSGVLAKILPYTILYFLVAQIMNFILFGVMGMPLNGRFYHIVLSELFLIISYQSIVVFFIGLTTNMRLTLALSSAYSMLSITYCGLTFPIIGMPAFSKAFSLLFPYSWFLKILVGQSLRGEPSINSMIPLLIMSSFVILGVLILPHMQNMLLNPKRWGKS